MRNVVYTRELGAEDTVSLSIEENYHGTALRRELVITTTSSEHGATLYAHLDEEELASLIEYLEGAQRHIRKFNEKQKKDEETKV